MTRPRPDIAPLGGYTRAEAAALYGVSLAVIDKAVYSGKLAAKRVGNAVGEGKDRKPPRSIRIAPAALAAWWDSLEDVA